MSSEEEENKLDQATGGISQEELDMVKALRMLGLQPKTGSPMDFNRIFEMLGKTEPRREQPSFSHSDQSGHIDRPIPEPRTSLHQYPKFSTFYGVEGKGDSTWEMFKFEVQSVLNENLYTDEQILHGLRRALKGSANDKMRRIGSAASPQDILDKLESSYGTIETKESVMKKFYTCEQKPQEKVEEFASRLEELFDKAVELEALRRSDTAVLKQVLHSGLRKDLKQMTIYHLDKFAGYDDFKKELRKMEQEMKSRSPDASKPSKAAVPSEKKEESEVEKLLKKINERIDRLEKKSEEKPEAKEPSYRWQGQPPARGGGGGRRGRGNYKNKRPIAGKTFTPTCFLCGEKGHMQRNCPTILAQMVCSNCKEKGHIRRDCPNE